MDDDGSSGGPLGGLLVADFSRVLAGPYATMLFGDLAATVVKVERPGTGDDTREWGPPYSHGLSTYFQAVNRNKRSIVLDLGQDQDREVALSLCAAADVVVENFRPGTMDRLGLGYHHVQAVNPGAVYCSITGFGRTRGAALPGYDLLLQAVGGLMSVTGPDRDFPTKAGAALVDVITGLHAAVGILAALRLRDATGQGQRVEVDLLSSLLSALTNQTSAYLNAGVVPRAMGNRHPSIAPYEVLPARDRPLVLAVGNDKQFAALCAELGVPALSADPRFATNASRVAHREELLAALEAALATQDATTWVDRLRPRGVPCGLVNGIDEAVAFAEELGLAPVVDSGDGSAPGSTPMRQVRHPIGFSRSPATYRLPPPPLPTGAEQAREVLRELGVLPRTT
jgi:crotonobetainyl-CoA:carnitine CoA-transferase CaiB-like acyl-CoA transferase